MNISGQKTVTTAGSAVQLAPASQVNCAVMVKALTTNTGLVYIGNAGGDVGNDSGLPLAAGDVAIFANAGNLADIWVDSTVDGEGVAWLLLSF